MSVLPTITNKVTSRGLSKGVLYVAIQTPKFRLFVWVEALHPSQQLFSHVGTKPPLPGYYQYFLEVNVSCSRIQHGDPSED